MIPRLFVPLAAGLLAMVAAAEDLDPYGQGELPDWAVPGETIVVDSAGTVAETRAELEAGLRDLGYGTKKRRGDWTIYVSEIPWYPQVMIHDSGYMRIKRRPLHFRLPEIADWGGAEKPLELALCLIQPTSCIRFQGLLVSKRRLRHKEEEVVNRTRGQMASFQDSLANAALSERLAGMNAVLMGLWRDGIHPDFEEPLEDMSARRRALVELWVEPAENAWGDRVRAHIEVFVDDVVQASPDSFLPEEIEAANRAGLERIFEPIELRDYRDTESD